MTAASGKDTQVEIVYSEYPAISKNSNSMKNAKYLNP